MRMNIQVFNNPQFGEIRTAGTAEQPLFCLSDICKVLDLRVSPTKDRLNAKGVTQIDTPTAGGTQTMYFVNEQNLYKVIMRSDKPQAEPFQDWVCGEVLPSIRKTGSYSVEQLSRKQLALMVVQAEEEKERLALENKQKADEIAHKNKIIENQSKYVSFAKNAFDSDSEVDIGEAAKILQLGFGRNTLFKKLREDGILMANNDPKQKYIDAGYFRLTQLDPIDMGEGKPPLIKNKVLVKQKGLAFLNLRYGKKEEIEFYKPSKAE
jgi:prophage antirepressor-like protein